MNFWDRFFTIAFTFLIATAIYAQKMRSEEPFTMTIIGESYDFKCKEL